jgi:predicted amidohydrolase
MNIVLLQLKTTRDYQKNLDVLVEYINVHQDKDIIVAPEVYLTGFDYDNFEACLDFYENAMDVLLPLISTQILMLTLVRREGEKLVNQAVVIHNHQVVHVQNKYKLFHVGNEGEYFDAGAEEGITKFKINGVSYGILICFELRFKALWQCLEGVDVIVVPAMWGKARKAHLEVLSQALAIMNQCYVLVCNSANEDMASSSAIVHPWGEVVMDDKAEVLEADIDLREVKKVRRLIPIR